VLEGYPLLGDFVNNPDEGYRRQLPNKITQNPTLPKNHKGELGSVFLAEVSRFMDRVKQRLGII